MEPTKHEIRYNDWNVLYLKREDILSELIDALGTKVMRLAYTYVKDKKISEDITQEVFLRCYKNLDRFRAESNIKTWIYKITVNLCKDYLKSWAYRKILHFEKIHKTNEKTPLDHVLDTFEKKQLSLYVLKLPIKYREVIILHYYEDYSIQEISELLQTSPDTIRTRMRRAKEKLRAHFVEEGLD
ncbi:sigma-70 family RNA polymerase sigma factor [Bacillus salitolerans]|uniref:Sigma-70 family RNA polymerase sigma factor n=1 Tax=Bacillus salitolerans TaxID=1437434 RepID=A0ABW4LUD9_9BACI